MVEIEDVSATANANLMVGYWTDYDNFVEPVFATPSAAEFLLTHMVDCPLTFDFSLKAVHRPRASSSTPSSRQRPTRHTPVLAHIRGHIWTRRS